jgi:hypothetical protein
LEAISTVQEALHKRRLEGKRQDGRKISKEYSTIGKAKNRYHKKKNG